MRWNEFKLDGMNQQMNTIDRQVQQDAQTDRQSHDEFNKKQTYHFTHNTQN